MWTQIFLETRKKKALALCGRSLNKLSFHTDFSNTLWVWLGLGVGIGIRLSLYIWTVMLIQDQKNTCYFVRFLIYIFILFIKLHSLYVLPIVSRFG